MTIAEARPARARPVAIGVDPGGRYTAVVVRAFDGSVELARVLDRHRLPLCDDRPSWARTVAVYVADIHAELVADGRAALVAAEDVTKPHPFGGRRDGRARIIDPGPIIDTAVVLGALVLAFADLVIVPPSSPSHPAAYPVELAPRARLGGPTDHARSAYDVAGAALFHARIGG